ncbi:MAG: restriction endonuclease [Pelagibacteraceae bacterium]|jgi:HJR/Mrr/RecB family endonuclease|nr:restriction endonuclease [Pelagibacteraceae bacterium]
MKEPKPKDFNLTSEFVEQSANNDENIFFKTYDKTFWLIVFAIALFLGSGTEDVELWTLEYFIVSIFIMLPVGLFLGVGSHLLSDFYNEILLPLFNKKYSNLKKYKKKLKEYETWFFRTQLDFWRSLSGRQFEIELASLLKKHGHTVKVVGGAGDKGIDIILDNNTAVQCKAYKSKVGPAAIRDLIGSMQNANYEQGILASVNGFSKGVYEYNKKNNIELLDASHYIQMQKELSNG